MGEVTFLKPPEDGVREVKLACGKVTFLTLGGRTQRLEAWALELSLDPKLIRRRLRQGLAVAQVLAPRQGPQKHGMTGSPEWRVWVGMRARCNDPSARGYEDYGGKGVRVCPEWEESFQAFYDHVGPRPTPRHTIDRIKTGRGYEPGNVRWATRAEQARNTTRNVVIEHAGERKCLRDWAQSTGIPDSTLWNRLFVLNWPVERALTTPRKGASDGDEGE